MPVAPDIDIQTLTCLPVRHREERILCVRPAGSEHGGKQLRFGLSGTIPLVVVSA